MMRRTIVLCAVVSLTLAWLGIPPAHAASTDPQAPFHASLDGAITGFTTVPEVVQARCGDGWDWVTQTAGSGEASGIGDVTFTTEHCARIVTFTGEGVVIRLGLGLLTLSSGGGVLHLAYEGMVLFKGDLATGVGSSPSSSRYVVVHGTGDFDAASGNGSMFTTVETVETNVVHHELNGSLSTDG